MNEKAQIERRNVEAGSVIFSEGDSAEEAYVVDSGSVEILVRGGDGKPRRVGMVGEGGMLGELALIDGMPRSATAVAASATTLLVVPSRQFEAQLDRLSPVMRRLFAIVGGRVRRLSNELARVRSRPPLPGGQS